MRQRRACSVLAGRITDQSRKIADQEDDVVTNLLELPQFVNQNRMPQVQVGCCWVETGLNS